MIKKPPQWLQKIADIRLISVKLWLKCGWCRCINIRI